jgi:transcriptional regulator with XRE-family HTH domain
MTTGNVGPLLRTWRTRRHLSQLDLAVGAGVSTRHLSYVETGKSTPSPELVMSLAEHLEVPLRERNALLVAAGHAPRYRESKLDAEEMAPIRRSIQQMLHAHDPYPALAVDRCWNLRLANEGATALVSLLPQHLLEPPVNVYRLTLHPDGLAGRSPNADEWVAGWLDDLRRHALLTGDRAVEALYDEVSMYPAAVAALEARSEPAARDVVMRVELETPAGDVAMFTTLTTFGTPVDITVDELVIELFWPADAGSAGVLRSLDRTATS